MLSNFHKMVYSTEANRTDYRFPFKVLDQQNLRVSLLDMADGEQVPLFLETDYQVTGVGDDAGGQVELTALGVKKAEAGLKIVLKRGQAYKCAGGGAPFPGSFDISYEEQWTGFYDRTDGDRKIYVKTVDYGSLANAGTIANPIVKSVPHGIVGLRKLYYLLGTSAGNNGIYVSLSYASPWSFGGTMSLGATSTGVHITNDGDRRDRTAVVTLVYTKNN